MRAEEAKNGNRKTNAHPILPKASPIAAPPANQLQTAKAAPRSIFAHHEDLHEDDKNPADDSPPNV